MFQLLRLKIKEKLEFFYHKEITVESPSRQRADLAIPLFKLAKQTNKKSIELAEEIKVLLQHEPYLQTLLFERGFLNIFFNRKAFAEKVLTEINKQKAEYGTLKPTGKVVCIDYSSPNIAKNFSVGHLRSTVIGAALYNLYEKRGYQAIGINHLGDWGTQFGKLIVAYNLWGDEELLKRDTIDYLQKLYVKFHQEELKIPEFEEQARKAFKKLEDNDEQSIKLWEHFKELSLIEFKKVYDILGVSFDYYQGESFYNDKMDRIVEILVEKNLLIEDQGALVVRLDNYNLPPALIKRTDGATLYLTRDLAALLYRSENYLFDKILYVVGNEQKLHFQQLKLVSELMDYDFKIEHVNFGLILIDGKKMATRSGKVVNLIDVIDNAIERAYQTIESKNPQLKNKKQVAQAIGISAIVFNDLKNDRNLDIDFDLDQMLSFEGMTGPYLQYSSVRIHSILKDQEIKQAKDLTVFEDDVTYNLILQLSQFSHVLDRSIEENGPHLLSRYLLNLARSFNQFYAAHKIIVETETIRNSYLYLIKATRIVLNEGLRLLGMTALDEM